jgi:hypothetical protein
VKQTAAVPAAADVALRWLQRQPLTADKTESVICSQVLCSRIDEGCVATLGDSARNLPQACCARQCCVRCVRVAALLSLA